ncbi:MAG: amino acid ABC transporter ATP-binding protein [Eubacterium sp.]|nr:amino acid ABC transporter ATP-binding protein [Eubacterium sp.]
MGEALLQINNLIKRFNDKTILNGISLNIQQGEVAVVVGPSGCGKSTLLRCINGLEEIQGGEIRIDGQVVSSGDSKEVSFSGKTGMVFQSYDLFPHLKVIDNLTLAPRIVQKRGRKEAEEEGLQLLERVGLKDRAQSFPRELSGGQKQRVAIVRTLMMHPEILLFDEVTAALDPEMVREVLEVILDLARQGSTMLIVTHEMSFARAIADRVLFIEGGHILEDLPPEQFFTCPNTERAKQFLSTFTYEQ